MGVNQVGTPNRTLTTNAQHLDDSIQHPSIQTTPSPLPSHQQRPRPQTLVLDTKNYYDRDEVDKRSSLGVFYKDKSFYDIKNHSSNNQTTKSSNNKKSNFYIELSPPDYNYYTENASESSHRNTSKIGQTTSNTTGTVSSFDNSDRNSNAKGDEAFLSQYQFSSFEINKNNKIHDRHENLTKKNSFEANDDTKTIVKQQTPPSSVQYHHHKNKPPSSSNQTTPKVLVTRLKKSNREEIENIIVDKNITSSNQQEHHSSPGTTKKKSSNCRIYGFIPKCAKRNDSTEPESLSEETNNNLDLLVRNKTLTVISKNNSLIMDRSVDSIGSCSLDVDADSTDFSGT